MDFTIEELSMDAWASIKTCFYDGWVIRISNGYTYRSNSVNLIYPSKINLEEKIKYCDELFTLHNLPVVYKVIDCEEHRIIEKRLEQLNYLKVFETSIQVYEKLENLENDYDGIFVSDSFTDEWIECVIEFNNVEEKYMSTSKTIHNNIVREKIVVQKKIDDKIVGCGYGVISSNYVGLFDIVIKKEVRGMGFGKEIVKTILSKALQRGVTNSYLQVVTTNSLALHLYEKLGFKEKYRYWYRKNP